MGITPLTNASRLESDEVSMSHPYETPHLGIHLILFEGKVYKLIGFNQFTNPPSFRLDPQNADLFDILTKEQWRVKARETVEIERKPK
jgi:hypothetical protein